MTIFGNAPPAYNWLVAASCLGVFLSGAVLGEVLARFIRRNRANSQFVSGKVPPWIVGLCLAIPFAVYLVWLLGHIMP